MKNMSSIAQKVKFSIKDFFSNCDQIRRRLDLVTSTEEVLNGKFHFLYSEVKHLLFLF